MNKLAEVFKINQRIDLEYDAAMPLVGDAEVVRSLYFLIKLDELAAAYEFSSEEIVILLDPDRAAPEEPLNPSQSLTRASAGESDKSTRIRTRTVQAKRYQNPYTGEILETTSVNHRTLKSWRTSHGASEVETWRI